MSRRLLLTLASLCLAACQASPTLGASCARNADCSAPLACRYGRCRAECTANRDCGASQSCIFSSDHQGVCQLDLDLGCEGGVGRMCPAGLVCANDRCINECASAADCPSDGACRFSPTLGLHVCVDLGRVDADAGIARDGSLPIGCSLTTDVCVGDAFACALRDGQVYCWGDDNSGQHGDLTPPGGMDFVPSRVQGPMMGPLGEIAAIACGTRHVCATNAAGDMVCWGDNGAGQLSNGGAPDTDHAAYVHVDITDPEWAMTPRLEVAAMVLGGGHTFVQRRNGHWAAWGQNADGELRTTGTLGFTVPIATYAPMLDGVSALGVGLSHSCAATATGVQCVGLTATQELGDGSLATLAGVTDLALGVHHSCALRQGAITCWGSDDHGQLGVATAPTETGCTFPPCSSTPVTVDLPDVARLVQGSSSNGSCAITRDGSLWCWGENQRGQVDGSFTDVPTPRRQSGLPGYVCDASFSASTLCALVASAGGGTVYCWGENGSGQIGLLPDGDMHPVPREIVLP